MSITKKQKDVFDYIKNYTRTHKIAPTQKEIKEHFGFKSFGSVQRYIKYLVNARYLECDWNARQGLKIVNTETEMNSLVEIPLFGDVAAGIPIEAIENPTETMLVPQYLIKKNSNYYALTVKGNSMIDDGIFDHDTLICKQQNTAEQGQTVIAIIDGFATVKKFYMRNRKIELVPANSTMNPITIDQGTTDFRIVGVLSGLIRHY